MDALLSDVKFEEFYNSLNDNPTIFPDELVDAQLKATGFQCPDIRVKRLIALATEKFLSDVLSDAYQLSKIQPLQKKNKKGESRPGVLTLSDLSLALAEHGIEVDKPEYYADSPTTGHINIPK
ncbi:Transcription initiation factor TFIID subunit 10 [Monocercomonoides exilis]|uniref:Transcription initiation factor TFIID subunit 10 n=1 Tax=Monocercomonoides exilis TaxID=2049356 RepID=UPI00355A6554|nr:Transcription initiation factor TFIID subunit 10 [Monocercomonoides exilis]|eukprot:MONOS_11091.1-p1 / transcript=MONOS_11091.1 / gene=MONOS_11091 / organism=Monocercomonoides_exilis_PA203 / gene_product=Transcription initiation factor TFIID subunit 10 / transcript_product=Transcription initiation factor TFIID subunit 10 / location=Mono_scaffold00537:20651-21126(+) / protein_length=123 / sequence_SO=supercontig / SO=protein_coding / is_pseudo=false